MARKIKAIALMIMYLIMSIYIIYIAENLLVAKAPETMIMADFKELPKNSVDVLCIGSSLAYTSFDTEISWNKYGISSYCISGPSQPIASSYYYLKEALKTQKPKIVLLETGKIANATNDYEYSNSVNYNWIPYLSINRWLSYRDTVDDNYKEDMKYNLTYFHSRYNELTDNDFSGLSNNRIMTFGFNPWWNYNDYTDELYQWDNYETVGINEEADSYLQRIIELCKSNDIELVFYLSPHTIPEDDYKKIYSICRKYESDIPYIDGIQLIDELELDADKDCVNGHISYFGAVKLTEYISDFLHDNYSLENHKGDPDYDIWETNANHYSGYEKVYNLVNYSDDMFFEELNKIDNIDYVIVSNGIIGESQINKLRQLNSFDDAVLDEGRCELFSLISHDGTVELNGSYGEFGDDTYKIESCNEKRILVYSNNEIIDAIDVDNDNKQLFVFVFDEYDTMIYSRVLR